MKIKVVSDLHLEFGTTTINNNGCDVLILSGDIILGKDVINEPYTTRGRQYAEFFDHISKEFPHIVYVAGNHEFYNGSWQKTLDYVRKFVSVWENVYFLENEIKVIDNLPFLGCTLWTDMHSKNPITMHEIAFKMNDYRIINNDDTDGPISPEVTVEQHFKSKQFLLDNVSKVGKCVVVTHMAPCTKSIHPRYVNDFHMNGGYASDLTDIILNNPQIKLWTHGHVHDTFDYQVGETRVICNPRGYAGYQVNSKFDHEFSVEV